MSSPRNCRALTGGQRTQDCGGCAGGRGAIDAFRPFFDFLYLFFSCVAVRPASRRGGHAFAARLRHRGGRRAKRTCALMDLPLFSFLNLLCCSAFTARGEREEEEDKNQGIAWVRLCRTRSPFTVRRSLPVLRVPHAHGLSQSSHGQY